MTSDQQLILELGRSALALMKRATATLEMDQAANVAAAFTAGAPFELRVRIWARSEPKFSVVQIVDGREIELSSIGGSK